MELPALQSDIRSATDRFIGTVETVSEDIWDAPLSEADPRPVAIVCDHVADAYDYLRGWLSDLLDARTPEISPEIVDELNRIHAQMAVPSRSDVIERVRSRSEALLALTASMGEEDLGLGDGLARRILVIAGRHPDDHRVEIDRLDSP